MIREVVVQKEEVYIQSQLILDRKGVASERDYRVSRLTVHS